MATGTLGAFEATTTSRHGETAPAENMDLTGPGSSVLDGRHDEISGRSQQNNEERPRTDDDWQTVLTLMQKKQQARERKRGTDSTGSTSPTKPHQRRRRTPKLPPLPKEDFKIVLRPHQGLPLKTISTPALAEAIVTACSNEIRETQLMDIHVNLSVLRAGGAHITGDRSCQRRLKRPRPPQDKQRIDKPKDATEYPRWFSSEDEELAFTEGKNSQQRGQQERARLQSPRQANAWFKSAATRQSRSHSRPRGDTQQVRTSPLPAGVPPKERAATPATPALEVSRAAAAVLHEQTYHTK
ncbi:hypothetical protein MTO96_041022 [Rhipicephalus appendiculatus]